MDAQERPTGFSLMGFIQKKYGKAIFQRTNAPTQEALAQLVHTISHRVAQYLERQGILQREEESSYLQLDGIDDDSMQPLIGYSVSYRIAVGPQQGRKVFTLQTLPAVEADDRYAQIAKEAGFILQAGVAAQAWQHRHGNAINWKGCVDIFQDLLFEKNACR
jgi:hypothetical protein